MPKVDATCPFRVAWLCHVLHVSPLNLEKKVSAEVCHKCSKIRLGDRKSSFEVVAPCSVKSMFIILDDSFLFASQRLQP